MHEVGEESRRQSYATVILTVDATLNMYMRRAGNATFRDCPETGASSGSCIALERSLFRAPRSRVNLITRFSSKKRNSREMDVSWPTNYTTGHLRILMCKKTNI